MPLPSFDGRRSRGIHFRKHKFRSSICMSEWRKLESEKDGRNGRLWVWRSLRPRRETSSRQAAAGRERPLVTGRLPFASSKLIRQQHFPKLETGEADERFPKATIRSVTVVGHAAASSACRSRRRGGSSSMDCLERPHLLAAASPRMIRHAPTPVSCFDTNRNVWQRTADASHT